MKKYSKTTLFFSIVFILLFIYLGYYYLKKEFHLDASETNAPPPVYQKTPDELADSINKQQYRLEYTLDNTIDEKMVQIIHLNKGEVYFSMEHFGEKEFIVVLKTPEEVLIDTLANFIGKNKITKTIDIAETGPYLLEVKTEGKWRLSFQ
ncbi:hypothetical protein ACFLSV_05675 [Bacteroidota bacterium]